MAALPTLILLVWFYDLDTHPNPPVLSFHIESVDCGPRYYFPAFPAHFEYFNVDSILPEPVATNQFQYELDVEDFLRQYHALDYCPADSGAVVNVRTSDNVVGDGVPFKAWWVNLWGADMDHNGALQAIDFLLFAQCYQGAGDPSQPGCLSADLNNSGTIDSMDYMLFAQSFNGLDPKLSWEVDP